MKKGLLIITIVIACTIANGCNDTYRKSNEIKAESSSNEVKSESSNDKTGLSIEDKESLFILNNSLLDIDVVGYLGEPEEKSEPVVWGADGFEHQNWYYSSQGIELNLIRNDNNQQTVNSIHLISPCTLKTSRGIGIGSSKEEVFKAYKNEISSESDEMDSEKIVVGTVYGGLIFGLNGDLIVSIFIGAAAE